MSDENQKSAQQRETEPEQSFAPQKPTHGAYNVKQAPNGKSYWNQVGVAWEHKDKKGHSIKFDSIPLNGEVTLRELRDKRMDNYNNERVQNRDQQPDHNVEQTRTHERSR